VPTLLEPNIITFVPILDKITFKYLFGTQKNIRFTEYLLEALQNKESGYYHNKLRIINNFSKNLDYDNGIDTNIRINIDNKEIFILCVYTNFNNIARIKSLMYLAFSLATHLNNITDLRKIKKHTQFNIVSGVHFRHQEFALLNKDCLNNNFIDNILNIYVLNSDKYISKMYRGNKKLCSIMEFLKANTKEEALRLARKGDKIIMDMWHEVETFRMDKWYDKYFSSKNYDDNIHNLNLNENIMKTKIDIARNMLKIGIDANTVIITTGLEKKDILKLKEE